MRPTERGSAGGPAPLRLPGAVGFCDAGCARQAIVPQMSGNAIPRASAGINLSLSWTYGAFALAVADNVLGGASLFEMSSGIQASGGTGRSTSMRAGDCSARTSW